MEKLLGIDPTGGTDPLGPNVIWVGDRRNFTETRWLNLRLAATAQTDQLTVFGRIRSPFQWHGNHAFVDAFSLVRAPTAYFVDSPARISATEARVQWDGVQSPDVLAIPEGTIPPVLRHPVPDRRARRLDRLAHRSAGRERDFHRERSAQVCRPTRFGCAAAPNRSTASARSRTTAIPASGANRHRSSSRHRRSACPEPSCRWCYNRRTASPGPVSEPNHRACGRVSPGAAYVAARGCAANGLAVVFIPKIVRRKPTRRIRNS